MTNVNIHKIIAGIVVCLMSVCGASAQTIVELNRGGNVRAKNLRDYDKALLESQSKLDSLKYVEHLTRGFNALHDDSLLLAKFYFEEALRLREDAPGNHIVRLQLARIAEVEGDFRKAADMYSYILRQQPDNVDVRIARAAVNLQLRYFKEAKDDCDVLLKLSHEKAVLERLYFVRASANMGMRLFSAAQRDFEQVLRLNPQHQNAPIMLSLLLHDEGRTNEALNKLNLYIQVHPESVDALLLRATFEMEMSQYEAARVDLDDALKLAPFRADLYLERANCFEKLGLKEKARKDRLKAKSLR